MVSGVALHVVSWYANSAPGPTVALALQLQDSREAVDLRSHHCHLPRADLWRAAPHAEPAGLGCPEIADLLELALLDLQPHRGSPSRTACPVRPLFNDPPRL